MSSGANGSVSPASPTAAEVEATSTSACSAVMSPRTAPRSCASRTRPASARTSAARASPAAEPARAAAVSDSRTTVLAAHASATRSSVAKTPRAGSAPAAWAASRRTRAATTASSRSALVG